MSSSGTTSTIERAFELARNGVCHSVADIRTQLTTEGFDGVHGHLTGSSIQRQLKAALVARGITGSIDADDDGEA